MVSMMLIPKAIFRGKFSSLLIAFSTENNLIDVFRFLDRNTWYNRMASQTLFRMDVSYIWLLLKLLVILLWSIFLLLI